MVGNRRFDDEITFYSDDGSDPEPVQGPQRPTQVPTALDTLKTEHGFRCGFHPRISVSEYTPVIKCTVCGEQLDPYDVLRQFHRRERNFAYQLEHLREEATRLTTDVERLKRERNNLRAQIRRTTG